MKITTSKPQPVILSAVKKYIEFIAPTYGPAGKKTLIVTNEFNHEAVDDGKRSSQAFEIEDEMENAVAQYIRETTEKGKDGTTTAAIIMSNIILQAFQGIEFSMKIDTHTLAKGLEKGLEEAKKQIKPKAIKTKEELYNIAHNSYNNKEIATLIAETVHKIGKDGVLAVEDSKSTETTIEIVNGLEIQKGYTSPYLVNQGDKVVLEEPILLIVNKKINLFAELAPLLQQLTAPTTLTIVADGFGDDVLNKCIALKMMGRLSPLLIDAPGVDKLESLTDIAIIVGAKVIDGKVLKLEEATKEHLGTCESIKSTKDKTVILGGKGKTKDYIQALKTQLESESHNFTKDKLTKRIAELSGGVAVIKVGAYTENEQKSIKTKVENAVNSTQIAFKGGVVPGAGKSLESITTSSELLNTALKAPRKQLEENGKEYLDENTVDPADVVITALETAVSIATGLITIGGISVPKRKKEREEY